MTPQTHWQPTALPFWLNPDYAPPEVIRTVQRVRENSPATAILGYLNRAPLGSTVKQLSEYFEKSPVVIASAISRLKDEGVISAVRSRTRGQVITYTANASTVAAIPEPIAAPKILSDYRNREKSAQSRLALAKKEYEKRNAAIIDYVKKYYGGISLQQIMDATNLSYYKAYDAIRKLKAIGLITQTDTRSIGFETYYTYTGEKQ